jgi:hypothetical protein
MGWDFNLHFHRLLFQRVLIVIDAREEEYIKDGYYCCSHLTSFSSSKQLIWLEMLIILYEIGLGLI